MAADLELVPLRALPVRVVDDADRQPQDALLDALQRIEIDAGGGS
jgi:hypothetical protein